MSERDPDELEERMQREYWIDVRCDSDDPTELDRSDYELQVKHRVKFGWGGPEYELDGLVYYAWNDGQTFLYYYDVRVGWQPWEE